MIVKAHSIWERIAMRMPRWLVPAIFGVRVGQDYTTYVRIHFFRV